MFLDLHSRLNENVDFVRDDRIKITRAVFSVFLWSLQRALAATMRTSAQLLCSSRRVVSLSSCSSVVCVDFFFIHPLIFLFDVPYRRTVDGERTSTSLCTLRSEKIEIISLVFVVLCVPISVLV